MKKKARPLAFLSGVLAGLRALSSPAALSWSARSGSLPLRGSKLSFLGKACTPWVLSSLAVGELIADQLPSAPSRRAPASFAARVASGALCGAALGVPASAVTGGVLAGALGAVIGTLGGYELRRRLAGMFRRDRPAALIEDLGAFGGLILLARMTRSVS